MCSCHPVAKRHHMEDDEHETAEEKQRRLEKQYFQQASFLTRMNDLRKEGILCDVIFEVEGKEINAHRIVIATSSPFFQAMFTSKMSEEKSKKITLQEVEAETIEALVEFAYTACIKVNDKNVQSLLSASNRYQIETIKKLCCNYLKENMTPSNCLGIQQFAEYLNCKELSEEARQYSHENFTEVCQEEEFSQLELPKLKEILASDQLTVKSENVVYDAAITWLKSKSREEHTVEVMSLIRYPLITRSYLSTTVESEPLLQDKPECLKMIMTGMKYHLLEEAERMEIKEQTALRKKKHDFQIAMFGGSEQSCCQTFDHKTHQWTDLPPIPEKRRDSRAVLVGKKVYVIGGSFLLPVKRIDGYNVATGKWFKLRAMLELARDCPAVCALNGKIYISGGTANHGMSAMDLVEELDPVTERIKQIETLTTGRYEHGMVSLRGHLWVIGGAAGNSHNPQILKSCEKCNPKWTKRWVEVPSMHQARKGHAVVVFKDSIYAIGGLSTDNAVLDTCEVFSAAYNTWSKCAPMPWKLRTVHAAALGDSIWVVGGYRDMGRLSNVFEYIPAEDRWLFHYNTKAFPIANAAMCKIDTCAVED
ncbi:protein homodimerization [Branchiostoma belcheri]|nr:protein homodimerization [Branchiostoma belcheri]